MKNKLKELYRIILSKPAPLVSRIIEKSVQNLYTNLLKEGSVAVDVGAHDGNHAFPMALLVGSAGKVHAFEPLPDVFKAFSAKIEAKGLSHVVVPYRIALSNYSGQTEFIAVKGAKGISGLKELPQQRGHETEKIPVEVRRMDDVVTQSTDFLKIDAEGGDFNVLQGAERILRQDRPIVVFESGASQVYPATSYGYTSSEFLSFFREVRYDLFNISGLQYEAGLWDEKVLWESVAIPEEKKDEVQNILWMSVLEALYTNLVDVE